MQQNNQLVAYLNNNDRANYAVYIGKNKIPGITAGMNNKNEIKIRYIPKWHTLKVGDDVFTSGMDNIFPSGIKVGIVTKILDDAGTQMVYIEPSIEVLDKKYFYIIQIK